MDRATWHRSLKSPPNMTIIHPPSYSPELNPQKHLGSILKIISFQIKSLRVERTLPLHAATLGIPCGKKPDALELLETENGPKLIKLF